MNTEFSINANVAVVNQEFW